MPQCQTMQKKGAFRILWRLAFGVVIGAIVGVVLAIWVWPAPPLLKARGAGTFLFLAELEAVYGPAPTSSDSEAEIKAKEAEIEAKYGPGPLPPEVFDKLVKAKKHDVQIKRALTGAAIGGILGFTIAVTHRTLLNALLLSAHFFGSRTRKQWQIVVLWLGIGLIVFMCLFPPWYHYREGYTYRMRRVFSQRTAVGYHCLLNPPASEKEGRYYLDVTRLLVQCAGVALLTGAGFYTLRARGKQNGLMSR